MNLQPGVYVTQWTMYVDICQPTCEGGSIENSVHTHMHSLPLILNTSFLVLFHGHIFSSCFHVPSILNNVFALLQLELACNIDSYK
jgi:hypothetical protein